MNPTVKVRWPSAAARTRRRAASAAGSLPLGRVAEVEDVAKAYLQLMDQDYATGTVTVIDGGTILV